MKEHKKVLTLEEYQIRLLIHALNNFRNKLIKEDVDTIDVDNLLVKTVEAPTKKLFVKSCHER